MLYLHPSVAVRIRGKWQDVGRILIAEGHALWFPNGVEWAWNATYSTLSQRAGLPTWDRPASACLASRIPYGTEVTPERLALIERGEAALRELGFRQFRVRIHDNLARVEISQEEMPRALSPEMAAAISRRLKSAGFAYVALDLQGYRQGSLNEALGHPASLRKTASGT